MGHLTLLIGCMFAQKTTELIRRIRRYKAIGYNVLVVNYSGDTRYGTNKIISHDTESSDAICVMRLEEIAKQVTSGTYQVLIIDEGQFYSDLYKKVREWADTLPIHIVVTGLDGDSDRNPFGDILKLVPLAEEVERQITFPVELAMGGMPGLEDIRSASMFGLSVVIVTFRDGTDIYFARQLINERLGTVEVPPGVARPEMGPVSTGLGEVFHYLLVPKGMSLTDVKTLQEWTLKPPLRAVPGVAEVNAWGGLNNQ